MGRTAREGRCDVTIYFGDGPSIEPGRIEVVDADLCLALLEIKSPRPKFPTHIPIPRTTYCWESSARRAPSSTVTRLATDMGVEGTAVHVPSGFPLSPSIVGAGIYRFEDFRFRLVGVVNGVAHFQDKIGVGHDVFTFLGPRNLARVAIYDRDRGRPKESPVRTDIIR